MEEKQGMETNTEYKKKIDRFRRILYAEAGIRAGTIGLAAGMGTAAVVLLYGRLRYKELLLTKAGIIGTVLFTITAVAVFLLVLRPKKKEVLARIDALGLQERLITMEELKQEETVMAKRQRQDAKERLAELEAESLKPRLYIKPLLWCLGLALVVLLLLLLPLPEQKVDEQAQQNALELEIVDEMIAALREIVINSEVNEEHKAALDEIVDALAASFTEDDTTLSRTAKIATASKRLDILESAGQAEITVLKQQEQTEETEAELEALEAEQKLLADTIEDMQDAMGTSIDVLNQVQGTFWTPAGPSSGTSYDVEPLPTEEEQQEGEEPAEGEEPPEGGEPGDGEPPEGGGEGEPGEMNGEGTERIYDPEQGEIGYGSVYEEYYSEILKALTETELSEEIREVIEDYANSLE